jgi:putative endopeptidase
VKKKLALVASLVTLAMVAPAAAQDDPACLDDACTLQSLIAAAPAGGADASVPTRYGSWGFDLQGMDKTVKPGDDWFRYVNGTWVKNTQIPADRSSYGAFAVLRDLSEARLRTWSRAIRSATRRMPTAPRSPRCTRPSWTRPRSKRPMRRR